MRTSSLQVKSKLCGIAFFGFFILYVVGINPTGRNLYPYTRYVPRNAYLCSTLNRLFSSPRDAIHNTSSSYKISYL